MKEKIYTIPITEAFSEDCFCPFCMITKRLEEEEIKYALGPAMMEPDYRSITNKKGFCKEHIKKLNTLPKALALSLVFDSHLNSINEVLTKEFEPGKKKMFQKNSENSNIDEIIHDLLIFDNSCAICDRITNTIDRYFKTFLYMLKTDQDFLNLVLTKDGFCLPHYIRILTVAREDLKEIEFLDLISKLSKIQKNKFEKYQTDVKDFIESFDYQNANKPCKAPGDTVIKVSYFLNGEFEPQKKVLNDI